jgi:hypothetical protein
MLCRVDNLATFCRADYFINTVKDDDHSSEEKQVLNEAVQFMVFGEFSLARDLRRDEVDEALVCAAGSFRPYEPSEFDSHGKRRTAVFGDNPQGVQAYALRQRRLASAGISDDNALISARQQFRNRQVASISRLQRVGLDGIFRLNKACGYV